MSTQSSRTVSAVIAMALATGFMTAAGEIEPPPSEKPGWEWTSPHDRTVVVLRGHKDTVHSVAFSPDGSQIASGSVDRIKEVVRLEDHVAELAEADALLPGVQTLANRVLLDHHVDRKALSDVAEDP